MYEQDYIMRAISNLIYFLARIVTGKDTATYVVSMSEEHKGSDLLHQTIVDLLAGGKINEAENLLFEEFDPDDQNYILVALDFYQRLNALDDQALQQNDFSREEIEEGLRDMASRAGIMLPTEVGLKEK